MLILISFDSYRAHVYFDVKISNFGKDPLNIVMTKHVSDDLTRKNSLYEDLCSGVLRSLAELIRQFLEGLVFGKILQNLTFGGWILRFVARILPY